MAEAEWGVMQLPAVGCQGLPGTIRCWEKTGRDLGCPASRTVREYISLVLLLLLLLLVFVWLCKAACGIVVPWGGGLGGVLEASNLGLQERKHRNLNHWTTREDPIYVV